jgi:hypothetical protein
MRTILVSLLAIAYVIFESIWAAALAAALLRKFLPQINFNFLVLIGICALVLNSIDLFVKCDYNLKAALRVNTFMWLVILTVVELSTGIL